MTLAENLEVLNLRAIAGQYDLQERHIDLAKLPVFLENQAKGDYNVQLDPALNGSDATLQINQSLRRRSRDREVAAHTADFRRALVAGDRPRPAQRDVLARRRHAGSIAPAETLPYSPGPEWRKKWSTLDVKQANELLDKIGLDQEGRRGLPPAHRRQGAAAHRAA